MLIYVSFAERNVIKAPPVHAGHEFYFKHLRRQILLALPFGGNLDGTFLSISEIQLKFPQKWLPRSQPANRTLFLEMNDLRSGWQAHRKSRFLKISPAQHHDHPLCAPSNFQAAKLSKLKTRTEYFQQN